MRHLKLFLSYSRADLSLADALRRQILSQGHQVWQDTEEMLAGDAVNAKLRRNLLMCDAYVVLITPKSLKSTWVLIELGGAWVSGIRLFPVVSASTFKRLPGPLTALNCCKLEEVPTKLLPALNEFAQQIEGNVSIVTDTDIDRAVALAASHLVAGHRAKEVVPLVKQALSSERAVRRIAHTAVRQGVQTIRSTFLEIMVRLIEHPFDHIRGEAYYCLGDILVDPRTYAKDEKFFCTGLHDESVWVQACCANVLKNFVPLRPETVNRLQECLTANTYRALTSKSISALVYYASVTLGAHRLRLDIPVDA